MDVGSVYRDFSAWVDEYLEPFGMGVTAGPLRAARELTRGIVFTGSVQLTNAARLMAQTPARLARIVKRLSLHLGDPHWNHQEWAKAVLHQQARLVREEDLIPIDATELAKPYSHALQYLCTVRDASRVGDPLVSGYWCWGAYHWDVQSSALTPLMLRPYSTHQPYYRSENDEWRKFFWQLRQATEGRGIWLSDRGGDRPDILSALLTVQPRWIVRLREDRALLGPDGSRRSAGQWANWALANQPQRGRAVTLPVHLPAKDVPQVQPPVRLWLVVPTYTFGQDERWVLLTRGLIDDHTGPRQVRHEYALRWRAEDAKRFIGQIWHVERFLVRSFLAIERILWCVVLAGGFQSMLQREEPELAKELEQEVPYWDKPFPLPGYRLARGIQAVIQRYGPAVMAVNA